MPPTFHAMKPAGMARLVRKPIEFVVDIFSIYGAKQDPHRLHLRIRPTVKLTAGSIRPKDRRDYVLVWFLEH